MGLLAVLADVEEWTAGAWASSSVVEVVADVARMNERGRVVVAGRDWRQQVMVGVVPSCYP